jgi:sulfatase maturation enzyme AslB (radical SAM superfamily)
VKTTDILRAWKTILAGRTPSLSIEITKECPLTCPGCYAYGDEHLGGEVVLRQVSDYKGKELIDRVIKLVDAHQPLHVSIVGGEPLVRFRELHEILPELARRRIGTQVVTSAVREIPKEWNRFKQLQISVSIDGLAPEHDVRRKPATYERILKNIAGHRITVHCTITRQMTERPGYLREFVDFWSRRDEVSRIWMSLFTPQIGETSFEILPAATRVRIVKELFELRKVYAKLDMPEGVIEGFLSPPANPNSCIFAKTTSSFTADLKTKVAPCQFGGNPDCSQCGCMASVGLHNIGKHRLAGAIPVAWLFETSYRVGTTVAKLRRTKAA